MKLIRYTEPTSFLNDWDSFFADPYRAFAPLFRSTLSSSREFVVPLVEWYEDDENIYAQIDLPGISREDLHIDAEDGLIRLQHEARSRSTDEESEQSPAERFEQVIRCPEGIEVAEARATLDLGVLRLTLPKAAARRPLSIEVK